MKKTRKTTQKTITAHIPVELLSQILADPENISLCHALVSAIITAERIRKPDGAAGSLVAIAHNSLDISIKCRDVSLARKVWPHVKSAPLGASEPRLAAMADEPMTSVA